MQIRYLRSVVREMPDGQGRLRARIALAYAALSLPRAGASALRNATRNLRGRTGAPDPSRRRPYLAQSDGDHGTAGRSAAAAPDLCQPGGDRRRRRCSAQSSACYRPCASSATSRRLASPAFQQHGRHHPTSSVAAILRPLTTRPARRCCTRRIPATSGSPWAATVLIADTGAPPPRRTRSRGPPTPAASPSNCRRAGHQYHRQCRRRHATAPDGVPPARPRHRRAFHGLHQRHLAGALQPSGRASAASSARRWCDGPHEVRCDRLDQPGARSSSPATTAMSGDSASTTSAG